MTVPSILFENGYYFISGIQAHAMYSEGWLGAMLVDGREAARVLQSPSVADPERYLVLEDTGGALHVEPGIMNLDGIVLINFNRETVLAYKQTFERVPPEYLALPKFTKRLNSARGFAATLFDDCLALKMKGEGCYLLRCREAQMLSSQTRAALRTAGPRLRFPSTYKKPGSMIKAADIEERVVKSLERSVALFEVLASRLAFEVWPAFFLRPQLASNRPQVEAAMLQLLMSEARTPRDLDARRSILHQLSRVSLFLVRDWGEGKEEEDTTTNGHQSRELPELQDAILQACGKGDVQMEDYSRFEEMERIAQGPSVCALKPDTPLPLAHQLSASMPLHQTHSTLQDQQRASVRASEAPASTSEVASLPRSLAQNLCGCACLPWQKLTYAMSNRGHGKPAAKKRLEKDDLPAPSKDIPAAVSAQLEFTGSNNIVVLEMPSTPPDAGNRPYSEIAKMNAANQRTDRRVTRLLPSLSLRSLEMMAQSSYFGAVKKKPPIDHWMTAGGQINYAPGSVDHDSKPVAFKHVPDLLSHQDNVSWTRPSLLPREATNPSGSEAQQLTEAAKETSDVALKENARQQEQAEQSIGRGRQRSPLSPIHDAEDKTQSHRARTDEASSGSNANARVNRLAHLQHSTFREFLVSDTSLRMPYQQPQSSKATAAANTQRDSTPTEELAIGREVMPQKGMRVKLTELGLRSLDERVLRLSGSEDGQGLGTITRVLNNGTVCAVEWHNRPHEQHFYRTGRWNQWELKLVRDCDRPTLQPGGIAALSPPPDRAVTTSISPSPKTVTIPSSKHQPPLPPRFPTWPRGRAKSVPNQQRTPPPTATTQSSMKEQSGANAGSAESATGAACHYDSTQVMSEEDLMMLSNQNGRDEASNRPQQPDRLGQGSIQRQDAHGPDPAMTGRAQSAPSRETRQGKVPPLDHPQRSWHRNASAEIMSEEDILMAIEEEAPANMSCGVGTEGNSVAGATQSMSSRDSIAGIPQHRSFAVCELACSHACTRICTFCVLVRFVPVVMRTHRVCLFHKQDPAVPRHAADHIALMM